MTTETKNASGINDIVNSIASKCAGTKIDITLSTTSAGTTVKSEALSEVANKANGTTDAAETRLPKVPTKFRSAAAASEKHVKEVLTSVATKMAANKHYAIDASLFKQVSQDFDRANQRRTKVLLDIIEITDDIQPHPDKPKTVTGYGGWDAFKAEALRGLGNEVQNNPEAFPYQDAQSFVDEYTVKLEDPKPVDARATSALIDDFARQVIEDQSISTAMSLTQSVFVTLYSDIAKTIDEIEERCPDQDFIMYSAKMAKQVVSVRVPSDRSCFDVYWTANDGGDWKPLKSKGKVLSIPADIDSPFHALQSIGDRFFAAYATQQEYSGKIVKYRDTAKGKGIEPNSFGFLAQTIERANMFFRPNGTELVGDQPELYAMLDKCELVSEKITTLCDSITGSNRELKHAQRRVKLHRMVGPLNNLKFIAEAFL